MDQLNYYFLHTFWTVAKEGSLVAAAEKLLLAQPTVSGQIRELEKALGQKLFDRVGRGVALTETGRHVVRYAEEIFALGRELMDDVAGLPTARPLRLLVGVADALPKAVAHKLLRPALAITDLRMVCREGKTDQLIAELAIQRLDVVLADTPLNPAVKVKAFSHLLGESGVSIVASEPLAKVYRRDFPRALDRAPFLLPTENTTLRRSLDQWFDAEGIRPNVKTEFEDSALLKCFGRDGTALFPIATAVEADVCQQFHVRLVGRIEEVRERFYAISVERRIKHPAVLAISQRAQSTLNNS